MTSSKEAEVLRVLTEIERIVREEECGYVEACVAYCERNEIEDVEGLARTVKSNPKFLSKLRADAERLNFIETSSRISNTLFDGD